MALPKDWPTRDPNRVPEEKKQVTEYQASKGGYYPKEQKPVPGKPKQGN